MRIVSSISPLLWLILFVLFIPGSAHADQILTVNATNAINDPAMAVAMADPNQPVTIRVSSGLYLLQKPLKIPPRTAPLTIEAMTSRPTIIGGGDGINQWTVTTLNGRPVWTARAPSVEPGAVHFHELWVNGKRASPARYPHEGTLPVVVTENKSVPWNQPQDHFEFRPEDITGAIPDGVDAIVFDRWIESRLPVESVDQKTHTITSGRTTVYQLEHQDRFYLEGSPDWIKSPGDWAVDRKTATIFYSPRPGEKPDDSLGFIPLLAELVHLTDASQVTFRGITFSYSAWNLPDPVHTGDKPRGGYIQADVGVGAAIEMSHCHDCKFDHCTFEHLSSYGIEMGAGCHGNVIDHCIMTDLAAGGVKIGQTSIAEQTGDQTFGNTVTDCRITDGGHGYNSACAIWVGQSYDNVISHNEIADFDYTGISVGWTWGYGNSLARGNKLEFNLIHHLGKRSDGTGPVISDMGGIYLLGCRAGTVVHGNVIHDIAARDYGGWGIYLDEGPTDVLIDGNLVYRTSHGGLNQHYGQRNTATNNVLVGNGDAQVTRTADEKPGSLKFDHNIVSWSAARLTNTGPHGCAFDYNVYHCTGKGKLVCGNDSYDSWKAAGQDKNSVMQDPEFFDAGHDNYAVKDDSPARKMGIVPPDPTAAGVHAER